MLFTRFRLRMVQKSVPQITRPSKNLDRSCPLNSFSLHYMQQAQRFMTCNDFDHDFAKEFEVEALFLKVKTPHRQRTLVVDENLNQTHQFIEWAYTYRPIKRVEFELPRQQCVVYLELKRDECVSLFPSGSTRSKTSKEYISLLKRNSTFSLRKDVDHRNLFGISRDSFIA
ncbi:hypothetical protein L1987_51001 [Smallanthus sonchifolius]|uniref:Uncharacterized protein n=1 Tax=Smallanthus sonchifolius TaxID=185202 RepID=A0ACB9ENT0_9ASTR|nr:hypothetical protein L1987_51001 [Smallanthus sonchifolius]